MFRKKITLLLLSLCFCFVNKAAELPTGFAETLLVQNLDPTDFVIAPDGRIFITIKSGKILIYENGALLPDPLLNIESKVHKYNERGLGHIVLDPDFAANHYYYVYYTVLGANHNRVSRFTANGNTTVDNSEYVLLDLDILAGTVHNAGAMVFGKDGKLYISTGDGASANNSQSLNNLLGKILRINADGTIPTDNPFYTIATEKNRAIWALGLRNPFSMSMDPVTGTIYANDVGSWAWEEVNEILKGKNYGWPTIEGKRTSQTPPEDYKDPLYAYYHGAGINMGCAIIGSTFYSFDSYPTDAFPATYHGMYFFADYCNGYIRMIDPSTGIPAAEAFATNINRPLAMHVGPDGSLYYLARAGLGGGSTDDNTSTTDGTLWKVTYTGSGLPAISSHPQDVLVSTGGNATFVIAASGAQPLNYQWHVNGSDIEGANEASYTFTNAQLSDDGKQFTCTVTNSLGSITTNAATLTVTPNTPPEPSITLALTNNATLYQAGYTLSFTGSALDAEDGTLPASSLTWKIDFHHDAHFHPAMDATSGISSGEYVIPHVGETSDNVWYRIYLTATDSYGLSKTTYQEIFPQKVLITLQTEPAGLQLKLDGTATPTPHSFTSVVGIIRSLEAPELQQVENNLYVYHEWEETNDRIFDVGTPAENKTYTAHYTSIPLGNGSGLKGEYFTAQQRTFNNSPALIRIDPTIDFNWGMEAPAPEISEDYFTVRWTGEIEVPITDTYTFYVASDDGIRLWVHDQLTIDHWVPQASTEWSGTLDLTAGIKYPIKIEYFEDAGGAMIQLYWSSSKLPKQIIPASQLSEKVITETESLAVRELRVYPTLVDQTIHIQSPHRYTAWTIYNHIGAKILYGSFRGSSTILDLGTLPDGVYMFKVNERNEMARFIKK